MTSCVGLGSQKTVYVTIPEEYLTDCKVIKAGGFEFVDILEWGIDEAESIEKCNNNLISAREINLDAIAKNKEEDKVKWYQFWR